MYILIGYRVARVEQTETPEMLKDRNDSAGKGIKKDKVVARELCSIMSKGIVLSYIISMMFIYIYIYVLVPIYIYLYICLVPIYICDICRYKNILSFG